ncbi:D-alanyl-D-alanine carboxypeptidase family protein [Nocardioides campestrisoli]|uniref:D-alanyl-D-alanine carboxypeptidase family protein n=1 Tax=Nocardioides campestrisoli TaxID=2736757 RepID=UPI00163D8773|nr:D-alanyl-D-alanine carboxypeptidase [Nocardioides campestrisoli]
MSEPTQTRSSGTLITALLVLAAMVITLVPPAVMVAAHDDNSTEGAVTTVRKGRLKRGPAKAKAKAKAKVKPAARVLRPAAVRQAKPAPARAVQHGVVPPAKQAVAARGVVLSPRRQVPLPPKINATAWAVADLKTGELLASHWAYSPRHPASTIKLLTALTAVDHTADRVQADEYAAGQTCSCAGVRPGRTYRRRELLAGALLHSGNDAAEALAAGHPQGRQAFYAAMQRKAESLGTRATRVANASGLTHEQGWSTARDLMVILRAAVKDPRLAQVMAQPSAQFGPVHGRKYRIERGTDYVNNTPGSLGKSGYTTPAQNTLVVSTRRAGTNIGVVTLGSPGGYSTSGAAALTDWAARHRHQLKAVEKLPDPAPAAQAD